MTNSTDRRRNFLLGGAIGGFAVMSGASAWSLVQTLSPDADAIAKAGVTVDLGKIPPGEQLKLPVSFRPLFGKHLTDNELSLIEVVELDALLDHQARNLNLPEDALATPINRRIGVMTEFVIYEKVCTRDGFVLVPDERKDRFEWVCPLCISQYDLAGRVRVGPATRNLPIPRFFVEYGRVIRLLPLRFGRDPRLS